MPELILTLHGDGTSVQSVSFPDITREEAVEQIEAAEKLRADQLAKRQDEADEEVSTPKPSG